jgi:hypothetical protein
MNDIVERIRRRVAGAAEVRTTAISGPRPLTKLQPDGGIAGPLHRVVMPG